MQKQRTAKASMVKLWETPIFFIQNPDHEFIKSGLVERILSLEKEQTTAIESTVAPNIKNNLSESKFDFLKDDDPYVTSLANFIMESSMQVISGLNEKQWISKYMKEGAPTPTLKINESWYHVTRHAGAHGTHSHCNCSWCGIYYIDSGEKDKGGKNVFLKPFSFHYSDPGTDCFKSNQYHQTPHEGLLVVFPSYLLHSAEPYLGEDKERIVVAVNMKIILEGDNDGEEK